MELAQLVKEASNGSPAAQKYLFDLLSDRMLWLCKRYMRDHTEAEEVLLDGFFKFFKGLNHFQYQHEAALHSWLRKIMVNECLMALRKRHLFVLVSDTEAELIPWKEEALDRLSAQEILHLIAQLPIGYKTVFNLYELEGFTHREIAEVLDISEGTSKSQLSKAKNLLQKMLMQHGRQQNRQHRH